MYVITLTRNREIIQVLAIEIRDYTLVGGIPLDSEQLKKEKKMLEHKILHRDYNYSYLFI